MKEFNVYDYPYSGVHFHMRRHHQKTVRELISLCVSDSTYVANVPPSRQRKLHIEISRLVFFLSFTAHGQRHKLRRKSSLQICEILISDNKFIKQKYQKNEIKEKN